MRKFRYLTIIISIGINFQVLGVNKLSDDFIPSILDLKSNLIKYYNKELQSEQKVLEAEKPNFFNLLSIFNLNIGRDAFESYPSLYFKVDIMKLFDISLSNRKYKIKSHHLVFTNRRSLRNKFDEVLLLIEELKRKLFIYNRSVDIFNIKKDIFKIERVKYKSGEISASEFLKKKVIFEYDKMRLEDNLKELKEFKKKILMRGKVN